jgi:transposase
MFNPLSPELNRICYLLALLAHDFLNVSRIRVKSLTLRLLMSYIYDISSLRVNNILCDLAIISRSGLLDDSPTTETRIAIVSILFLSHVTVAEWLKGRGRGVNTEMSYVV